MLWLPPCFLSLTILLPSPPMHGADIPVLTADSPTSQTQTAKRGSRYRSREKSVSVAPLTPGRSAHRAV